MPLHGVIRWLTASALMGLAAFAAACGDTAPAFHEPTSGLSPGAYDAGVHAGIVMDAPGAPASAPLPRVDAPPSDGIAEGSNPPDAGSTALAGPYPIVLMHGMGGFNELDNLPFTVSYFSGVQADLEAHGYTNVFVTVTSPYDTSENRAAVLAPQIRSILQQTGAAKVNLIGHSQGGLDARVLASPAGFDMGDVIASVTTVSTPHRGTPVADLALGVTSPLPSWLVDPITDAFLLLLEDSVYPVQSNTNLWGQLNEMSTAYMASTFNPKYTDAPGVVYSSYAARTNLESGDGDCDNAVIPNDPADVDVPQVYFELTAAYMQLEGYQNDGLVPIESAKWGTFVQCVPADHLKEVGLLFQNGPDPISGFDHLVFFRNIVARLRAEGF